jgi:hypothetical protein
MNNESFKLTFISFHINKRKDKNHPFASSNEWRRAKRVQPGRAQVVGWFISKKQNGNKKSPKRVQQLSEDIRSLSVASRFCHKSLEGYPIFTTRLLFIRQKWTE